MMGVVVILGLIGLYLLPTSFAVSKPVHPYASAIFALNLLLGWTFIGWVAALVWALAKPRKVSA